MQTSRILVGDVGGTNVRFAIAEAAGAEVTLSDIWKRPGEDFPTFDDALEAFLSESGVRPDGASLGVAGAVSSGRVELLHRQWTVDCRTLASRLGSAVSDIVLVNDFVAMARAAPELGEDDVVTVRSGQASQGGSIVVCGPGTGFGLAVLKQLQMRDPAPPGARPEWTVVGGEGGHQVFAPQTPVEWRLFERLKTEIGYVSNETVASGSGFLSTVGALAAVLGLSLEAPDPTRTEVLAAMGDPLSLELCRLRARTIMTVAGDAALSSAASGGVFLAGGVSQALQSFLSEPSAIERFVNRGPRSSLMEPIPVYLIRSGLAPLLGAAHLWLDHKRRGWL
jgi:glucokinase